MAIMIFKFVYQGKFKKFAGYILSREVTSRELAIYHKYGFILTKQ